MWEAWCMYNIERYSLCKYIFSFFEVIKKWHFGKKSKTVANKKNLHPPSVLAIFFSISLLALAFDISIDRDYVDSTVVAVLWTTVCFIFHINIVGASSAQISSVACSLVLKRYIPHIFQIEQTKCITKKFATQLEMGASKKLFELAYWFAKRQTISECNFLRQSF